MPNPTPLNPYDDAVTCPTISIELARAHSDVSDVYTSNIRHEAAMTNRPCPDCGCPLLDTQRWFERADGLITHRVLKECCSCPYFLLGPEEKMLRGRCRWCGDWVISNMERREEGYLLTWDCWSSMGETPTCSYRRVL